MVIFTWLKILNEILEIGKITFPNSLQNPHGLRMHRIQLSLSIIFGAPSQLAYGELRESRMWVVWSRHGPACAVCRMTCDNLWHRLNGERSYGAELACLLSGQKSARPSVGRTKYGERAGGRPVSLSLSLARPLSPLIIIIIRRQRERGRE